MPFYLNWIYKKGHRFWTILQMETCLSIKKASYIQKKSRFFILVLETWKSIPTPFGVLRIECRWRMETEISSSWSKVWVWANYGSFELKLESSQFGNIKFKFNRYFGHKERVSGSFRHQQSIRSTLKGVCTNFQLSRSSFQKVFFPVDGSCIPSARWEPQVL